MKVYEHMALLETQPAGAEVAFSRIASENEVPKCTGEKGLYDLNFIIREVDYIEHKNLVTLDGWAE